MNRSSFDANAFNRLVLESKFFSVSQEQKTGVSPVQGNSKDKAAELPKEKSSVIGRVWKKNVSLFRNLIDSIQSKWHSIQSKWQRFNASAGDRMTLTGSAKGRISNHAVLNQIEKNISNLETINDCDTLKITLTALKRFGADPAKCQKLNRLINKRNHELNVHKDKTDERIAAGGRARNLTKALTEHLAEPNADKDAYITETELAEIQSAMMGSQLPVPIVLSSHMDTDIGVGRKTNEDAEFIEPVVIDGQTMGTLTGVLDGHSGYGINGKKTAELIKAKMPIIFSEELQKANGNATIAFESAFVRMQKAIVSARIWDGGSTAVISYIDKSTNRIYTATLGDSEAMICREIAGKQKLIPLSTVRDWGSEKDMTRAEGLLTTDKNAGGWLTDVPVTADEIREQKPNPKSIRIQGSINLSRSLGDVQYSHGGTGIIQKPKITEFQLEPGDLLLLVCDGVTDYLPPKEIVTEIGDSRNSPEIAQKIISKSKQNMEQEGGGDNVSVIAIAVS